MTTIHVEAHIKLPLDNGSTLPLRQTILAETTATPGLVVFPLLLGPLAVDNNWWSVTHTATGKRIPISFRTSEAATSFANAIGALCNWEADQPQVTKEQVHPIAIEHGGYTDQQYMAEQRKAAAARKAVAS